MPSKQVRSIFNGFCLPLSIVLSIIYQKIHISNSDIVSLEEQNQAKSDWHTISRIHESNRNSYSSGCHILYLFVSKLREISMTYLLQNKTICGSVKSLEDAGFFKKLKVNVTIISKNGERILDKTKHYGNDHFNIFLCAYDFDDFEFVTTAQKLRRHNNNQIEDDLYSRVANGDVSAGALHLAIIKRPDHFFQNSIPCVACDGLIYKSTRTHICKSNGRDIRHSKCLNCGRASISPRNRVPDFLKKFYVS